MKLAHGDRIIVGFIQDRVETGGIVESRVASQDVPCAPPINSGLVFDIDNFALLNLQALSLNIQTSKITKSNVLESTALVELGERGGGSQCTPADAS